ALGDIKALHRPKSFARTDRNGQIRVDFDAANLKLKPDHGTLNNFQVNPDSTPESTGTLTPIISGEKSPAVLQLERSDEKDEVMVVAPIPRRRTRVTLTIDVEPAADGELLGSET